MVCISLPKGFISQISPTSISPFRRLFLSPPPLTKPISAPVFILNASASNWPRLLSSLYDARQSTSSVPILTLNCGRYSAIKLSTFAAASLSYIAESSIVSISAPYESVTVSFSVSIFRSSFPRFLPYEPACTITTPFLRTGLNRVECECPPTIISISAKNFSAIFLSSSSPECESRTTTSAPFDFTSLILTESTESTFSITRSVTLAGSDVSKRSGRVSPIIPNFTPLISFITYGLPISLF